MKRLVTWGILVVALMASMSYASAQADGPVPEPLPLGPDTSRFDFFVTPNPDVEVSCSASLQTTHKGSGAARPFASNNPADPCKRADELSSSETRVGAPSFGAITIAIVPAYTSEVPMDTESSITGEFTLKYEKTNAAIPAHFGAVKPKVSLVVGETVIASWDGAGEVLEEFQEPTTSEVSVTYTFDLGAAPEKLPKGAANLVIDMTNSVSADKQELRAITQRVVLAQSDASRGHILLPFVEGAGGKEESGDGNETGGNETGNQTDGNQTGNQTGNEPGNQTTPEPTNTTAGNNTTAPPPTDESGFLPGFEVVAVVSAALIALAYVSRERRRPPIRVVR